MEGTLLLALEHELLSSLEIFQGLVDNHYSFDPKTSAIERDCVQIAPSTVATTASGQVVRGVSTAPHFGISLGPAPGYLGCANVGGGLRKLPFNAASMALGNVVRGVSATSLPDVSLGLSFGNFYSAAVGRGSGKLLLNFTKGSPSLVQCCPFSH
ncbi:hypothetical protein Nepgr_005412 [Nepenthes gracilis]|uniref:Uncharacterized protein n=1 Tax=Nepenthes gracilis TaxID=150966 RepID=A0AAD3S337_NEPGR|nr:hypothetical protein Nepgr_005412 [Nepenthes gracilis]